MVSRVTRPVRRHVSDYVGAFKNFTDNAQVYLYSIFLQSLGGSMVGTVFALYIKSAGMRE